MRRTVLVIMSVLGIVQFTSTEASAQDVRYLLKRLEENTDRFAKSLDDALDHSSLNGSRTEDEINAYVHDFEEATDRLKDDYEDRGYDPDNAREVIVRARKIDCFMRQYDLGIRARGDWQVVRADLDAWERNYRFAGAGGPNPQLEGGFRQAAWRSGLPCEQSGYVGSRTSGPCVKQTARKAQTKRVQTARVRTTRRACDCPTSSGKGR
jgi:hypothetical protein